MGLITPIDSVFLLGESREHPMHVGGLQLFVPPADAGPDYARQVYQNLIEHPESRDLFRTRPARPLGTMGNISTTVDQEIDFDYHVRLSALPRPGEIKDLLTLVSRMHGSLLDRHRPLWEFHVIEGLEDGRLAIYTKVHHALLDGVSALKMLMRQLSPDADDRDVQAPWAPRKRAKSPMIPAALNPLDIAKTGAGMLRDLAGLAPASVRLANQALRDGDVVRPMQAPATMFNVDIGGARRFAAQSWSTDRLMAVSKATGSKLNDVVLAMCSGALRQYLIEHNGLPDEPLIAAVPVSLREAGDEREGGNAISIILCNLGTNLDDPVDRLVAITRSMNQGKETMHGLSPLQAMAFGAFNMSSIALSQVPGYTMVAKPSFNILISNVPGPREELYYNGARLDGLYPVSIVLDGFALNITLTSRAGFLDFGLIGCRHSVPHLQRLLTHLEDSLVALEKATA
ncbi:WS/DGAT/MGAT family O-acyltransferase [Antrihabitans cavernicola]|uniref:Diacylglycerol O-acyltransferase n=1 Tax=Antrihabitans cavernicola TaxID=2495913 RepID=A0A5A7S6B3_9NOCA|nr:wax ester/triacylglycerol synthase family O-acyltransferase [Spelaeibacter cavernicola]KAA0019426.1 wax ester/triacylglycerol synthase family O-acyltransferase [Spelaeibacter cavernicola]